jgi:hypothetical protein
VQHFATIGESLWKSHGFSRLQGVHARLKNLVVLCGLASWAGAAWAGPGVIVDANVEAFVAPSSEASVVTQLGRGAQVCVLDASNHTGVLLQRPRWLAIRLPGGVGYVPVEAVDLSAPAPDVHDCGAAPSEPADMAAPPPPAPQPPAPVIDAARRPRATRAVALLRRPEARAPLVTTEQRALARPPLLWGMFVPPHAAAFLLNFGTGRASLDKQAAAQRRIGDAGITFNGAVALTIWDVVMLSAAFSAAFPSDDGSFTQVVEPETGPGDPHTAESSLSVHGVSVAAGLRTPYLALGATGAGWVGTALFAEYGSAMMGGNRSIANCVDCREDDLNISGGTFWRSGIDLVVPTRKPTFSWGLTVSYVSYAAGAGFSDEVRVGFSCWWHPSRARAAQ